MSSSKFNNLILQVYLSLYTIIGSMVDEIIGDSWPSSDTLSLASLKVPGCYSFNFSYQILPYAIYFG